MLMQEEAPPSPKLARDPIAPTTPDHSGVVAAQSGVTTGAVRVPVIARFLPSLTDLAFLMPVFLLFLKLGGARKLLADGDTGWHLATGAWILSHHQVPHVDMFSFTRAGAPWFAWEWLWDATFALLFKSGGLAAVVLASLLVICLTSAVLFRLIRRKCDNGLVAIAITLLAAGGCAVHWLARPHLFTILFLAITLHITDRAHYGRPKLLLWLLPLTLVWTNLHGGFFVVFLVLACYIGSNLLNALIERDSVERRGYLRRTGPWLAIFAACLVTTLINPYGWNLHRHLIQYVTDSYAFQHIAEFQGLNFHMGESAYFEPLMIGSLGAAVWAARQRRFAEIFLAVGWMHLALIAVRNLPLFIVACSPLVAAALSALIQSARSASLAEPIGKMAGWFRSLSAGVDSTDRIPRLHLLSAAGIAIVALLLFSPVPLNDSFKSSFNPKAFPVAALPVLTAPATHRIWAREQWGDYLIYRLYPSTKVFIDGRSDFYGDKFGEDYLRIMNAQVGWDKTLDRYGIDTVAVSPDLAISSVLKVSRDWRVVYDDHISVVFRRNGPVPNSFASDGEGNSRDRAIAKSNQRDPAIAQPRS